jgi:dUTP pyrophosphatase
MDLRIKPLTDELKKLYLSHSQYNPGDSGLDVFFPETKTINPGESVCIDLMIQCEAFNCNENISYYIYPRSSITKTPLRLANSVGIIDAGYRGNIMVYVDNIKNYPFKINQGERLFQICSPTLVPISFSVVNELSNSNRGTNGFGSSGF